MKPFAIFLAGLGIALAGSHAVASSQLIWSDEFTQAVGSAPDPSKWTYDLGGGGWGNQELEVYTNDPANVSIVADPDSTDGRALAITVVQTDAGGYTSARLKTQGLYSTQYGRIEARLKMPRGQGLWPAFWMLGDNIDTVGWPACGEIDIMENLGKNMTLLYGTLHSPGGSQGTYTLPDGRLFSDAYHLVAIDWSPNLIRWSVDNQVYFSCTPSTIPAGDQWMYNNAPSFLLLNVAVGGSWGGAPDASTVFPQTLYVDYVRVYALLTVTTLAGQAGASGHADGSGSGASFNHPADVAVDGAGNVYVADTYNDTIRMITPAGDVTTMAGLGGTSGSADGNGAAALFSHPSGVAVDGAGNVYVADTDNDTIRRISSAGGVTTVAGQAGTVGAADGNGTAARFNSPSGIAVDSGGTLYIADSLNHTLRKITSSGDVSTIAGSAGSSGAVDGTGTAARFFGPQGLALDSAGDLYVADTDNNTVRKVIISTGAVTTVAGMAGSSGSTDGPVSETRFNYPSGVAVDAQGNVFVADTDNHTLRAITPSGEVAPMAGLAGSNGTADGAGSDARLSFPTGIAVDSAGHVYVADTNNQNIRRGGFPAAPFISHQPQSQTVTAGASIQFSVTASGEPPPSFQWYLNGAVLAGATGPSLSLTNVQATDAGDYTVTVANTTASVTSNAATLTVNAAPSPTPPASGGGGGGGGAVDGGFILALAILCLARVRRRCAV